MLKPPLPLDETARLLSLHSLRILDTPAEDRFDRITRMAKRFFDVEICLISLVDAQRQWFKSKQGLDACETDREISFCGHAILSEDVFVVNDASKDVRFADNPLVTAAPSIRFYAGCPIHGADGYRIGTLCLIASRPRDFSASDNETLRDLTSLVEDELKVASQVTVDDLTQIANRRGFHQIANHMMSLCRRTGTDIELAFFDLDGFKEVNDSYGHAAGDELLRHFAKLLIKCFRTADVIGRLGGDEFVVLMAGSSGSSDLGIARLEEMAAAATCDIKQKLAWSVGRIQFDPTRHSTIESLVAEADSHMYDDKARKRKS
ncbi:MAG: sensor domain-containing diguanylate cyclase, partial [Gammaproteobacteria bacterium]|nr:sensor domain-containing diguanylate cyclase [Gammaproteobacteria bacterium]